MIYFANKPSYQATKLLEVLFFRELVARQTQNTKKDKDSAPVTINLVNPGLCSSTLGTDGKKSPLPARLARRILDRTTEVGARTFVLAASAPAASHGEFQSDGANQEVEGWIYEDVGRRAQAKVFEQTMRVLEGRREGVGRGVGL